MIKLNYEYINKSFRILHLTKQPDEIMSIYSEFMYRYECKHRKHFNFSESIRIYNEKQAETFYRYCRKYYTPRYLEDKLFIP